MILVIGFILMMFFAFIAYVTPFDVSYPQSQEQKKRTNAKIARKDAKQADFRRQLAKEKGEVRTN